LEHAFRAGGLRESLSNQSPKQTLNLGKIALELLFQFCFLGVLRSLFCACVGFVNQLVGLELNFVSLDLANGKLACFGGFANTVQRFSLGSRLVG
jgi:hypothetical protein